MALSGSGSEPTYGPDSGYGDDLTVPGCPNRAQLELFAAGASDAAHVSMHLPMCPVCREIVRQLNDNNALVADFVAANKTRLDPSKRASSDASRSRSGPLDENAGDGGGTDVVPGFRVEGEIHRGAQGVVYRAEQLSTRRKVALKTLLQGKFATSRQRLRFEREVEVVASLRHPNIVTLFESGRTRDGLAFFAMELVSGHPLSDLLKSEERPPLEKLLPMFVGIVKAVAYAHQKGVIHRDLKPANILIDEELIPHILDFGLARTARGEDGGQDALETTAAGEFLGTFAYAAPEQLKGDPDAIDVRTDIFALGVIFYEILAGERPWQLQGKVSIADLLMARLEQSPTPPSTVRSGSRPPPENLVAPSAARPPLPPAHIDRDLDIIALKCLKSAAEERYQTATALAEDLERFLNGEPIQAREDSRWYVARKWVMRHKLVTSSAVGVVVLTGLFILALVGALAASEWHRKRSELTLTKFRDTLRASNPETGLGSMNMTLAEWLDVVEKQISSNPDEDLLLQANILNTVESLHLDSDDSKRPLAKLENALTVSRESASGQGHSDAPEVAEALHNLGRFEFLMRRFDNALGHYEDALAMHERLHGRDAPENAMTMQHLAAVWREKGELDKAFGFIDRAAKINIPLDRMAGIRNAKARLHAERADRSEVQARRTTSPQDRAKLQAAATADRHQAIDLYNEARDMILKIALDGAEDFRYAKALASIGGQRRRLHGRENLRLAVEDLQSAIPAIDKKKGAAAPAAIDARVELVLCLLDLGDGVEEALKEATKAKDAAEAQGTAGYRAKAGFALGLAQLAHGDARAVTTLQEALESAHEGKLDDITLEIEDALKRADVRPSAVVGP